jgi:hypothetical protein
MSDEKTLLAITEIATNNTVPLQVKYLTYDEIIAVAQKRGWSGDLSLLVEFAYAILKEVDKK